MFGPPNGQQGEVLIPHLNPENNEENHSNCVRSDGDVSHLLSLLSTVPCIIQKSKMPFRESDRSTYPGGLCKQIQGNS